MSNGFIGDRSWRQGADYDASSEAAGYPAIQARHNELARVWRSASADIADTVLTITLDMLRPVNAVIVCNHNLSRPNGVFRVRLYSDAAKTILTADSGWVVAWDIVYQDTDPQAAWDTGNAWDRTLTADDVANRYIDKAVYFDDAPTAYIVEITFDDEENSAGYVQTGLVEVAAGFYLPLNFEYGAQYGIVSRTQITESAGGTIYPQVYTAADVFRGNSSYVKRQDALSLFYEFLRRTDKHTPFWWSPDVDDTLNGLRHSYMAYNDDVGLISYAVFQRDSVNFSFKRML